MENCVSCRFRLIINLPSPWSHTFAKLAHKIFQKSYVSIFNWQKQFFSDLLINEIEHFFWIIHSWSISCYYFLFWRWNNHNNWFFIVFQHYCFSKRFNLIWRKMKWWKLWDIMVCDVNALFGLFNFLCLIFFDGDLWFFLFFLESFCFQNFFLLCNLFINSVLYQPPGIFLQFFFLLLFLFNLQQRIGNT